MDFVLVLGLAVWRVAYMLNQERGPLDIFLRLRAYLAKKQKRSGGLYDMISCFYCLSIWVSMVPAVIFATNFVWFILLTLILSTIAIFLGKIFDKLKV